MSYKTETTQDIGLDIRSFMRKLSAEDQIEFLGRLLHKAKAPNPNPDGTWTYRITKEGLEDGMNFYYEQKKDTEGHVQDVPPQG